MFVKFRQFSLKYLLIILFTFLLIINPMGSGLGQDLQNTLQWKPFGIDGDVAYISIRLDGLPLFAIAAERTQEEQNQWSLGTIQIRRNRIESRLKSQLEYLIDNQIAPESLQVTTTRLNQQIAVQIIAENQALKPIVTVTSLDAEIYGLSELEVGQEYAQQIQKGLIRGLQERQPEARRQQIKWAIIYGAIALSLLILLFQWQKHLFKLRQQLRQKFHELSQ
jgi:moderate conductance mechanosensitive channel